MASGRSKIFGIGLSKTGTTSLANALHILGYQTKDNMQAAVRAAHDVIVRGLTKLNPQIPVVSRAAELVPHAERRGWNHLWLVDPLNRAGRQGIEPRVGDVQRR